MYFFFDVAFLLQRFGLKLIPVSSAQFIFPEETQPITRCFQFHYVNLHHNLFLHHNLMYAVISVTRRFDVQCKYFIAKSYSYVIVDGSHLFSMHQVSHCQILVYTIYSTIYTMVQFHWLILTD